jgi:hypothetical protein
MIAVKAPASLWVAPVRDGDIWLGKGGTQRFSVVRVHSLLGTGYSQVVTVERKGEKQDNIGIVQARVAKRFARDIPSRTCRRRQPGTGRLAKQAAALLLEA